MVTRIHKRVKPRLFLREHRRAKGFSAVTVAGRMEMERESLLRLERESWRVKYEDQVAYADAIGLSDAAELHRPPGTQSLDSLVAQAPKEVRDMAADAIAGMVSRLGKKFG